ncbi:MAG: GNAT family N-acetyltransferase [Anaerolineae bacterium]
MTAEFTLRPLESADSASIARLRDETPDTGTIAFKSTFLHDPYELVMNALPNSTGVVAQASDYEGIVGLGLLRFGEARYEGETRPYAYLNGLSVHPNYRRKGIASALAHWRVEKAKEKFGERVVIYAGVQSNNDGSFGAAKGWSQQQIDRTRVGAVSVRTQPPTALDGWEVRTINPADYEQVAERQNSFYHDFNFYQPYTADQLHAWLEHKLVGINAHTYYVAVNREGHIGAGIGVYREGEFSRLTLVKMPAFMRVLNAFLKVIPSDGVMKRAVIKNYWFENPEIGNYLWETVRWLCRDTATNLMIFYDRNPLPKFEEAIKFPRLSVKATGSLVVSAPVPMSEERPIYFDM